jgi:hypothetical protein
MLKRILLAVGYVAAICGMCEGMDLAAITKEATKTLEMIGDIDIADIDSKQICVLEQNIAYGDLPHKTTNSATISENTVNFRKKLAELALDKLNFSKNDAAMKGALICFALQSTSSFSMELWKKHDLDNKLFTGGRVEARKNCMSIYDIAKERQPDTFIPEQIWSYMYSKMLVPTSVPE